MSDIQNEREKEERILQMIRYEKLADGICLTMIGSIVLIFVVCYQRKRSTYLYCVPIWTLIWGITGIIAWWAGQAHSLYDNTKAWRVILMLVRSYSIGIVHWIFVFKYFSTS